MGDLNLELIQYYIFEWMRSNPSDTGITLKNCWGADFNKFTAFNLDPDVTFKKAMYHSFDAENNSCFSRILPLAIWGYQLSNDDFYEAVKLVCFFSHCKPAVIDACYLYCLAVKLLIQDMKPREVYEEVKRQAKEELKGMQKFDGVDKPILDWFYEIDEGIIPKGNEKQSNMKYAFVHAFYHLKKQTPY